MPRQTREESVEIVVVRLRERDCGLVGIEIVCPNANAAGLPHSLDSGVHVVGLPPGRFSARQSSAFLRALARAVLNNLS
jgi:hypothetical protein